MANFVDPRERAFDALIPVAPTVDRVLTEVDACVVDDAARNARARARWTSAQRKTTAGYGRFCWTIDGLKDGLRLVDTVSYISTPSQEANNLFLWRVDGWLTIRVKSEPSELAYEATEPLFPRETTAGDETVCLSWAITPQQMIRDPRFVSVHDYTAWSISLAELLRASDDDSDASPGVITPLPPRRPGPGVSSNLPRRPAEDDVDTTPTD